MVKATLFLPIFVISLASRAFAHPGEEHDEQSEEYLMRRSLSVLKARNCDVHVAKFLAARKAKRSLDNLQKRQATSTSSAAAPHYTSIQNTTCITSPEVTEGPYYINDELVRQDVRDGQEGNALIIDIGILDTSTCKPLSNAYVEIWSANATGSYAGFTSANAAGSGGDGTPTGVNMTTPDAGTGTNATVPTNGTAGGGAGMSGSMSDFLTFGRGGWFTGEGGVVEMTTNFPGFYTGRTTHIHLMVRTDYEVNANGTISSRAGSLHHIGQMFFDQTLQEQVQSEYPYNTTTQTRTTNDNDSIMAQEQENGYSAIIQTEFINGVDISDGLYGYITVGVDSTSEYSVTSNNFASIIDSEELASASAAWNSISSGVSQGSSAQETSAATSNSAGSQRFAKWWDLL
ncbi:aromatic compound dioxygenase [Atractiella rhizophila]|nr:aromatic compound dioxygenase [Atractiella rhizophila]